MPYNFLIKVLRVNLIMSASKLLLICPVSLMMFSGRMLDVSPSHQATDPGGNGRIGFGNGSKISG
jgi:hypothetical protein